MEDIWALLRKKAKTPNTIFLPGRPKHCASSHSCLPTIRSPSFDLMEPRVVGERASTGRSLASLHLHTTRIGGEKKGHGLTPFHAYMSESGPGEYTPDVCAPLLPDQGRRRFNRMKKIRRGY